MAGSPFRKVQTPSLVVFLGSGPTLGTPKDVPSQQKNGTLQGVLVPWHSDPPSSAVPRGGCKRRSRRTRSSTTPQTPRLHPKKSFSGILSDLGWAPYVTPPYFPHQPEGGLSSRSHGFFIHSRCVMRNPSLPWAEKCQNIRYRHGCMTHQGRYSRCLCGMFKRAPPLSVRTFTQGKPWVWLCPKRT